MSDYGQATRVPTEIRTDAPGYEAVLVWRGTPAVVFAFTSTRTEVYVMARAGCRILVFERFST